VVLNVKILDIFTRKFSTGGKICVIFIALTLFIALFAPFLTAYPWDSPSGASLEPPSKVHIMGTDDLGIDLWAQICYGTRSSIIVGVFTALISCFLGTTLGILSGYYGGIIDYIITSIIDMMMAIPSLPAMIVVGAFFGSSLTNIVLVLALFSWAMPARIIRSKIISVKQEMYIKVAEGYGASFFYITQRHFLPQIFPLMAINFIKLISRAIISEASLSFLGLGDPTSKSWGLILNYALNFQGIYFTDYWKWWVVYPLLCIMSLVLTTAFVGREFEKIMDTKI